ncbi:hypothetical protein GOP47_0020761 [Adiantum capillus-veneris]|uniref:Protein kinase domain-containing protein n=1 Tax=Adiantum capillus-veneris TaxID=13818 RepID=A0A9D4Z901_ADICA|nr:hypothetical protein GOP47_0020761 [Adiantum capillus-veneris]
MPSSSEATPVHKPVDGAREYSSDEEDEDSQAAFFTIDITNANSQPELPASDPIPCPPLATSLESFLNPECEPGISSSAELSTVDSSLGISISPADSFSLSTSTSSFSVAGYAPIQSTSTSSSSTPANFRRPISRSASDSNFKAHVGVLSVAGSIPIHEHSDKSYSVLPLTLSRGRSNNSFEASLNGFKESEWLEEGDTVSEADALEVTDSSAFSYSSLLRQQHEYSHMQKVSDAPFQRQRICFPLHRPSTTSWVSLFKNLPQAERSLLCSQCKQMSPVLRNVPRRFSYTELEAATNNFSEANFLAEGGFGFVYRGELNGQAIAVKQHKLASTQGYKEFRSEVELLSCAQHRNLVMLLGYCDENGHRMLVYEFVCNKSLDWHLSPTKNPKGLIWAARLKIAIGAARALRYLHEESRVGCIVHRDMRPNNILLTHDYEPMVGDFGLARSNPEGQEAIETRVIGTFGYLAPEYAESGQVSWRADVYAFGVVLLELITGRKAIDLLRPPGQQSLSEWARPRLLSLTEVVDSRLDNFPLAEMRAMMQAAFLCISKDPAGRPRMSQVLHILEGEGRSTEEFIKPSIDVGATPPAQKVSDAQNATITTQQLPPSISRNQTRKQHAGSSSKGKPRLNYSDML